MSLLPVSPVLLYIHGIIGKGLKCYVKLNEENGIVMAFVFDWGLVTVRQEDRKIKGSRVITWVAKAASTLGTAVTIKRRKGP